MANASGSGIQLINDLLLLHGQAGFLQIAEAQTGSDVTWTVQQASQQQPVTMPNPVVTAKIPALSLPTTKRKSPAKKHPLNANSIQKQHQLLSLPHARVRTIMKTAPNVSFLSQEAVLLAAKSAEMFIRKMVKESYQNSLTQNSSCKEIKYNNLVQTRNEVPFKFLKDFIPQKITVTEYQRQVKEQQTVSKAFETKNIHDKN